MVIDPTKKPASAPKAIADMITIAMIGLKLGVIKKAALPAVASAIMVARTTSSLTSGFFLQMP